MTFVAEVWIVGRAVEDSSVGSNNKEDSARAQYGQICLEGKDFWNSALKEEWDRNGSQRQNEDNRTKWEENGTLSGFLIENLAP